VLPLQRLYPICGTGDHSCVYPYEYCTVWVRGWVYRSMRVPRGLALTIFNKGMPLLANEVLWAVGVSALTQIFSTYNLNVVGALNIANTITNLFNVAFISMGRRLPSWLDRPLVRGYATGKRIFMEVDFFQCMHLYYNRSCTCGRSACNTAYI